ncbi:MAG: hypothetical protein QXW98_04485 [Candidatus Caldarchaeum sp.]
MNENTRPKGDNTTTKRPDISKYLLTTTTSTRKRLYVFIEDENEIERWTTAFRKVLDHDVEMKPKSVMAALKIIFALAYTSEANAEQLEKAYRELWG